MKTKPKTKARSRNPEQAFFFYRVAVLLVLILPHAAGGGLTLLWLRGEISASASRIRANETRLAETRRRLQFVNVKIAEATTPDSLRRQAAALGLTLGSPRPEQVVRMSATRRALEDEPQTAVAASAQDPVLVSFELALIKNGITPN
jgi:hypothetical protein